MKIYRSIICSIVIISLLTCVFYQSSINVYANEPLALGDILSGSDEVADGMSALGFNSEQIRNILSLERHEKGFYSGIQESIDNLKQPLPASDVELTSQNTNNQNLSKMKKESILPNGNPPADVAEQNSRIIHVYNDATAMSSDTAIIADYMVYFYLSHYVDNPCYSKDNPNFDQIYANNLTPTDLKTYDKFIFETHLDNICDTVTSLVSDFYLIKDSRDDIIERYEDSNHIMINTLKLIKDDADIGIEIKNVIINVISRATMKYYTTAKSSEELIQDINESLEPLNLKEKEIDFANFCVTGVLALLSTTFPIDSYSVTLSIYYYDYYSYLVDRAKLASLQYSFSERLALRTEAAIDEWY
ncbi:MAG: hypothetical protein ACI4CS_08525 [Candidatus Weimeria sp.]